MKKIVFLLITVTFCTTLYAGDGNQGLDPLGNTTLTKTTGKDITDAGFFVHLVLSIPSMNYGYPPNLDNDDSEFKFGVGPGLELGNMFKINDVGNNAIGVKAVWLSTMYTAFKIEVNDTLSYNFGMIQGSALRVGPYFTMGLTDEMAIDLYYTAGASIMIGVNDASGENLGLTHNAGVGYRFSVLSVGFDINFGAIKSLDGDIPDSLVEDYKSRTNHIRLFVGVKI
ncbi:MAG: hypothetical protein JKX73_00175 [Flavobacteriales bacterium]|nr:hypothetical protein [Flavobacteriales bacterium]